jgi:glycosyltransferase involved in cell wall biosynthesis
MLRVVLCGDYPTDERALHGGGVQVVTYYLARALAAIEDVEVHVVCATRRPPAREIARGRLNVHFLPRPPLPRLLTADLSDVPRLVRAIRRLRPDIVHGQGQTHHGLAAVRCGLPHIVTPHGVLFIESPLLDTGLAGRVKSFLLDRQEREVFARARHMILISPYLREVYGPMLRARTHVVENPVEEAFFRIERAPEPGRLLFVGTVVARKRVHLLVEALGHLRRAGCAARLRIVGPPAEPEAVRRVREAVRAGGLEGAVDFAGAVTQERILDEYARADLLLLSSREETAPQVMAQAMAAGVPIVAVAAAGVPHMVRDGETAILVEEASGEAIARAVLGLLSDPAASARLSQEGRRQAAERFLDSAVARRTVEVYRAVLGASSR